MDKAFAAACFVLMTGQRVENCEEIPGGLSSAGTFYVKAGYREYFVKVTGEALDFSVYETLRAMHGAGMHVIAPFQWKYFRGEKKSVLIYDWMPGKTLDAVLERCTDAEKAIYGKKAAALLREFHGFAHSPGKYKSPYRLYQRYASCIFRNRIQYPYKKEMAGFVWRNRKELKERRNTALTHQDFRPWNILVREDALYLFDFETAYISDPYSDFVFCISMQPDAHIPYSRTLIEEYFGGDVPAAFWLRTAFYCIMAVQKYAIWKYRRKRRMVQLQAEHLYALYDELRTVIPGFWRDTK